ncbi:MAG: glutamate-cysteine ligase family protein [Desulfobacterales bacterium]
MNTKNNLHLFEGFGVELEYMIVDRHTLDVLPASDQILHRVSGAYVNEVEMGKLAWSNELALHVIELKTNGPARALDNLPELFQKDIRHINDILTEIGGKLMPGGMHPWMNPLTETRLWPHDYNAIYEAYNRIFNCQGHGWSNLQSTHLNLPFYDDEEFARLHTAVRLVLPLLPALAASTPVMDGNITGIADNRLEVYRTNQKKIPLIAGDVIPEPAYSKTDYERRILLPLYAAIAPYDPENTLQDEWLNSRGAIARFERNTIEIRLLDIQECPLADIGILSFIAQIIRALTQEQLAPVSRQQSFEVAPLADIFKKCIIQAEDTLIENIDYLSVFGFKASGPCRAKDLLGHLADRLVPASGNLSKPIAHILSHGTLSSRITRHLGGDSRREKLKETYDDLCRCLAEGKLFG